VAYSWITFVSFASLENWHGDVAELFWMTTISTGLMFW
jgi:hypothetical protein